MTHRRKKLRLRPRGRECLVPRGGQGLGGPLTLGHLREQGQGLLEDGQVGRLRCLSRAGARDQDAGQALADEDRTRDEVILVADRTVHHPSVGHRLDGQGAGEVPGRG